MTSSSQSRLARLREAAPVLLSADRAPSAAGSDPVELALGSDTADALIQLAAAQGVDAADLALAALIAVLHRHTGHDTLLLVADDLPLRGQVRPDDTFTTLLNTMQADRADARAHGDITVETLADSEQDGGPAASSTTAFTGTGVRAPTRGLRCALEQRGDNLVLRVEDGAAALSGDTVEQFAQDWRSMIEHACRDPDEPLGSIKLRAATAAAAPTVAGSGRPLVELFRTVAREHAERTAVLGASGELSYASLDRLTDAFAAEVRSVLGDSLKVALLCAHDVGAPIAVWSVLKAGAAYVPLDPRHPDTWLSEALVNADVDAVACDLELRTRAIALARERPVIQVPRSAAESAAALPPPPVDALAYLLHTSGTTGRPKAVAQSTGNVAHHALTYARSIGLTADDRVPLLARYSFDAAVMDLFGAHLTGAALVVMDPYAGDSTSLAARLSYAGATVLHCTPTLFRHLASASQCLRDQLGPVRAVVLGGEEVVSADVKMFIEHFGEDCLLVNGYGPTECTVALQHVVSPTDLDRRSVPIGTPAPGIEALLLDEQGEPADVFGELALRSPHVALCYWNAPDLTEAAFVHEPGLAPVYRTGDLARRLRNGAFVHAGRKDRQVKIRGHRVEPGESEGALRAHPTVAQAAVVVDDADGQGRRMVAYVTSATSLPPDGWELLDYLRRNLPDYSVPAHVVVIDELPIGPTGKLDRHRLPPPTATLSPDDEPPVTPLELAVAGLWCDVLDLPAASLKDDFMTSGGDSLQLMALLAAVKASLGVDVVMLDFLAAPTLADLVRLIEDGIGDRPF